MRKIYKVFAVAIIFSLLNCGVQQGGSSCDDIDLETVEAGLYDITSMKLELSREPYASQGFEFDTTAPSDKDNVFFHVLVVQRVFANHKNNSWKNPSVIKSAHACSLARPYTDEVIKNIIITSDNDFSATHLSGSDLSEYFEVYAADYGLAMPMPLNEFIESHNRSSMHLRLRLTENPSAANEHRFTVKYIHQDDEEFIMSSPQLLFQ